MKKVIKRKSVIIASIVLICAVVLTGMVLGISKKHSEKEYRVEMLEELDANEGTYDAQSIVLRNTSPEQAKEYAEKLDASLRITGDGEINTADAIYLLRHIMRPSAYPLAEDDKKKNA